MKPLKFMRVLDRKHSSHEDNTVSEQTLLAHSHSKVHTGLHVTEGVILPSAVNTSRKLPSTILIHSS